MTDDQPAASRGAVPAPASVTASGTLPYPLWMLFGLGVFVCVAWLGTVLVDLWGTPATHLLPLPLRGGIRVVLVLVLVLAVPALILLVVRSPRQPARRHARAFFLVEALVVLTVALPSLLPYSTPADVVSLPLRVPTLSLGVVLAAVDPW